VLTAKGISLARGGATILDGVSLSVGPGSRLGVVGPNGIGKSTLLAVLAGELVPDAGTVERTPATSTLGYLSQEDDALAGESVLDYLARRTGVAGAAGELDRLTEALEVDPSGVLDAYGEALERYLALGGDDFDARAELTCREVGLPADRLRLPVADLSGGQAARARLAAILLARFDVWLLDEPTNDLDFDGLERLESFLRALPGAVVTVSHDRAFLDRVATRILEIEEQTHRGAEYAGGWSEYVERRALARSQMGEAYESWRRERQRLSERVRAQRAWSEQGVRKAARSAKDNDKVQRDFRVNRTEKQASKVRISERALERLGTADKPWEGWQLHLDLAPAGRSGDRVASLESAVVRRGGWTLGPVDLDLAWGERVAVTGANGGGKSTLLAALLGAVPLEEGRRFVGPSVRFGDLDQRRSRLWAGADGAGSERSLLQAFGAATGLLAEESRSLLAKFGLTAEHVGRTLGGLSPGERTRAVLAALMAAGTNCLVLDEPTNHLDLPAIEQLEQALDSFSGTLVVVTHDRWLLETLRVDRVLELRSGRAVEVAPPLGSADG